MTIESVESTVAGSMHLVVVRSSDGVSGVGQSACWAYPEAAHAVVEQFRGFLLGRDPNAIERHWHGMWRMGPFRGSIVAAAVSAIDIALWDLKGKRLEVPVWELLGGRYREKVRLHCVIDGRDDAEIGLAASRAVEQGFTALKLDPLPPHHTDRGVASLIKAIRARVNSVREVIGDDIDLILELHRALTPHQALSVLENLRSADALYVEDPIQIDSIRQQTHLASVARGPLGLGERWHSIWEFAEALDGATNFVIRADPGLAGGISHCKKIAAVAEAHHSVVSWHNTLGPVLTSAAIQLSATIPNALTLEYVPWIEEEFESSGMITTDWMLEQGFAIPPDTPGIGVNLKQEAIEPFDYLKRPLWSIPDRADGSIGFTT